MRKPVIAGNWKMYKTPAETAGFLHDFALLVAAASHAEIVVCGCGYGGRRRARD
jgi:triosephosphate isomerase